MNLRNRLIKLEKKQAQGSEKSFSELLQAAIERRRAMEAGLIPWPTSEELEQENARHEETIRTKPGTFTARLAKALLRARAAKNEV